MTEHFSRANLAFLWLLAFASASQAQQGTYASTDRAAAFISAAAKSLAIETVDPKWNDFAQVRALSVASDARRVAGLSATLDALASSEDKIFPKRLTNDHQLAASIVARVGAMSNLKRLVPEPVITANDTIVLDYIASELADLRLVAWKKIPYGAYLQAREDRDSKRLNLLMQDRDVAREYLLFRTTESSIPKTLAGKTLLLAFMNGCATAPSICEHLD